MAKKYNDNVLIPDLNRRGKKKAKDLTWLIILLVAFIIALGTTIFLGFYLNWFGFKKDTDGEINFQSNIVIKYSNLISSTDDPNSFSLCKVDSNGNLSALLEDNVVYGDDFVVANPTISAVAGSTAYYTRVKLDYNFVLDVNGIYTNFTLAQLAVKYGIISSGATLTDEDASETLSRVFSTTLSFNDQWVKQNDWYYLVGDETIADSLRSSGAVITAENMKENTSLSSAISIFKNGSDEKVHLTIAGDPTEAIESVDLVSAKIILTIDACEANNQAFAEWE